MNEVQAAFGLLQLKHIDKALSRRKDIGDKYREALATISGITCFPKAAETTENDSYFPLLVGPGYPISRDCLYQRLKDNEIYSRRYFYPLITEMPMYRGLPSASPENLPVAKSIADRVLCLPIYPDLKDAEQDRVIDIIASA